MDRDTVIAALEKDPIFAYRGPEDLSLLPSPNQSLIEVAGLSFVRRGYFQFYEGKLWTMILELDPDKVDHFPVYTSLVRNTASPASSTQGVALGRRDTRMALERPLSLRYMDMTVYAKLRDAPARRNPPASSTARASWADSRIRFAARKIRLRFGRLHSILAA